MITTADILKANILVVDDQVAHSSLLEQILTGAGYVSVTTTNNPREVCDLHRKNHYSLILLDLQMPGMDGFQVMEELKAIETGSYLPVLVLTAQPDHKLRALKAGARDFVSKPFDLAEVLMRAHNLIEVRLLHREAELRTERAETSEQAISGSELRYRRLFEAAPDGILILNVETGRITDVNPFLCKMLALSAAEMIGSTVADLRPFKGIESNQAMLKGLQINGFVRYEDLSLESEDGRHFDVQFICSVYHVGTENVIQCNIRDITDRKRAEIIAFRLGAIVEFSEDAVIGKDLNSIVTSWNKGAEKIFGYTAGEMVGTSITRLIPPDRQEEELKIMGQVEKGENVEHFETLRMAKNGHPVEVSVTVSPIKDKTGKIVGASKVARDITERKRTVEARRMSETRYRTLFDYAPDGIVIADPQSNYLDANPSMCRMLGYTRDELIGKHASDIVAQEEIPYIGKALEIIEAEAGYQREWLFRRKDGSQFEAEVIATAMPDGNLMAMIRDITERKRTMDSLVESEDRLRFVTDNARVGLVVVNRDRRYAYANNAYAEVLDLPGADIVGQRVAEVLPKIFEEQIHPQLDRAFAGERVAYELRKPDPGGDRHFAIKYEPTKVKGEVTLVIVVVTDITEIKRAEEAQRATEARYQTLFDCAPIGIVIADTEGYWLDANVSMCRMLGYARHELIGLHASKIVAPEDSPNIEPALSRVKAKLDHHRDGQFRRRDGSIFPTEIHATLMPDGNLVGMIRDITERKRAQQEIHDLNIRLEQRVAERTTELEAANKELEAFSYSVSHDLRAPLRAVDGFSQAVLEDYGPLLPSEGQDYLKTIREGAQRMGTLIDDLLAFSRLSRAPLNKQTVNTGRMVRAVFEELNSEREGRQIEIRIGELPSCRADSALLKQVWTNLLSNAVKYTGQRNPAEIEVGCKLGQENVYFVRDNGAGFNMKYAHKLFGVFQRLHRSDQFEGTGVGLAIVQRIIHRHGGRIWVEATVNGGATFYFTLKEEGKL